MTLGFHCSGALISFIDIDSLPQNLTLISIFKKITTESEANLFLMMASVVTKLESLKFSGKDEDFVLFSEQFEARMYLLKLRGVLLGTETEEDFLQ